ncbi:MAG: protein kinase [Vicinamibacteria bacterium]
MATIGRYEILDKLGEGAMGVVYRARDTSLGRVVALKMLSTEIGDDDELHQRFRREAEAIGRLSHPHIVSVYDLGEADGRAYMAMELLDGEDLRALIETRAIGLPEKVRIMAEICDGVGYAHSRGVVHRDIKPANILVTGAGRVKLLDFGLARVATRETITRRGVILGTPDYMSPEQAMGRPLDHRTDIFSSGAVFYEFLTCQKPFRGKTLHSVLYQIISESPEPVLTLNPEAPARLAAIVHRMLRKEAPLRPASMEVVGAELREIHGALRRSGARSAVTWPAEVAPADESRGSVRDLVTRGRAHLDAGRFAKAAVDARQALAIDPDGGEAAEIEWQADRGLRASKGGAHASPETLARVAVLLSRAAPGRPEDDARRAIAELALIAPDDPRVGEAIRERGVRS